MIQINQLQEKELQLLKLFVEVCEQLNLKYYLVCGSALGAVKYHGFIPWDDDIDVALPRKDYELFLAEAPTLLPSWVFVQNYRTDPDWPGMGSKLRNSNTTFIEKEAAKFKINHGIYIDIFPLDGCPADERGIKEFEKIRRRLYRKRYVKLLPPVHKDIGLTIRSLLYRITGYGENTAKACAETEKLYCSFPLETSKYWCNFANSMRREEYAQREQYGDGVMAEFEGLRVRIPQNYDAYLGQKYGDYLAEPPESEKKARHPAFVDIYKPYTEYLKNKGVDIC